MSDFVGSWFTTFGPMTLEENGKRISGTYQMGQAQCFIDGVVKNERLEFRYKEPAAQGQGWFALDRPGKFSGRWRQDGTTGWAVWEGVRGFDGIWQTTYGPMRLFQEADRV